MSNKTHIVTLYFIKSEEYSTWATEYPFTIINRFRDIVYELGLMDVIDVNVCDVTKKLGSIHLRHFKYCYDWYPYIEVVTGDKKVKLSGIRKNLTLDKLIEQCDLTHRLAEYQKNKFVIITEIEPNEIITNDPTPITAKNIGPADYDSATDTDTDTDTLSDGE
jgi:hypothetical protein